MEQTFVGANWWKVDLHGHTPMSFDFGAEEGQRALQQTSMRDWLLAYMRSDIGAVVIADHNSHEGIDLARSEAEALRTEEHPEYRDITLLPGVEITVDGGFHLLGVFEVDTPSEDINSVLHRCQFKGDRGTSEGTTVSSFQQAVKEIVEAGGLPIPAHADGNAGVFKHDRRNLDAIESDGQIIAAEVVSEDGAAKARGLGWVPVLGSDAHHLDGTSCPDGVEAKFPGSHFTWFKLEEPTLRGIRLALNDGENSVMRGRQGDPSPASTNHSYIQRLTIARSGDTATHEFSPWMNALIGGRGVGKSTLVELIRLAAGRFDELPARLQADLSWFSPIADASGSRFWDERTLVSLDYVKSGTEYRIEWRGDDPQNPRVHSNHDGTWIEEQGVISERFPVLVYSQKQIYETAQDPQSLLKIIDAQQSVSRHKWLQEFESLASRYRRLRSEAAELASTLSNEVRLRGELSDVEAGLTGLRELRESTEALELEPLEREDRSSQDREILAAEFEQSLRRLIDSWSGDPFLDLTPSAWSGDRDRVGSIRSAMTSVQQAAEILRESRLAWEAVADTSPRRARIAELRAALVSKAPAGEGEQSRPVTIGDLEAKKGELERALFDIERAKTKHADLLSEAQVVLASVNEHRRSLTRARQEFVRALPPGEGNLRLEVFGQADEGRLEEDLRKLTRKANSFDPLFSSASGLRAALSGRSSLDPRYVDAIAKLKDLLKSMRRDGQASPLLAAAPDMNVDPRFFTHLASLDLDEFEVSVDLWFPEDYLRVRYSTSDDPSLRALDRGSPGQKTATLLAAILQLSDDPLILDQPEDDLENKLIYDLVVRTVKAIKPRRQVIVATHNANVVVNGDAELVRVLSNAEVPRSEVAGSMQSEEVRSAICLIMEGGEAALKARYARLLGA